MKKNVEILAPAGEMESLRQAVFAGCDAVYVGGSRFGARAQAVNFDQKQMLEALDFVHLHGKKLYMTVNTLLKEQELERELLPYILPYYEAGLDGVIVQDLGVLSLLHQKLPQLPLHASTQLTLTGPNACNILKQFGITRVVPSRELSLDEIKWIKQETGLEIECFVQGALCLCYSGQCLMSSMIGGRSGNRGRCAQPCRKEYEISYSCHDVSRGAADKDMPGMSNKTSGTYLLSPKDLCTIEQIPDLIEAGIDSFKIEGRMKKPAYAAFTSHLYRKYSDIYLEKGREGFSKVIRSSEYEKDKRDLMDLYNRGGFTKGYYYQYHGTDMMAMNRGSHFGVCVGKVQRNAILLTEEIHGGDVLEIRDEQSQKPLLERTVPNQIQSLKPGQVFLNGKGKDGLPAKLKLEGKLVYRIRNEVLLEEIQLLSDQEPKRNVAGFFTAKVGEKAEFILSDETGVSVQIKSEQAVSEAKSQPVTEEKIISCLNKIQNIPYQYSHVQVHVEGNIFMPVGQINELRRNAFLAYEKEVLSHFHRETPDVICYDRENHDREKFEKSAEGKNDDAAKKPCFSLTFSKEEQVEAFCNLYQSGRLSGYEDEEFPSGNSLTALADVVSSEGGAMSKLHKQFGHEGHEEKVRSASVRPASWHDIHWKLALSSQDFSKSDLIRLRERIKQIDEHLSVGLVLPWIFRKKTQEAYQHVDFIGQMDFVRIHSLEQLGFMKTWYPSVVLEGDVGLYGMNQRTREFLWSQGILQLSAEIECNEQELSELGIEKDSLFVYGHLPLMQTVQCMVKNGIGCQKKKNGRHEYVLTDEKGSFFGCAYCEREKGEFGACECLNVLFNGVPIALHREALAVQKLNPKELRMDFTREDGKQTEQLIEQYYQAFVLGKKTELNIPITKGHFKRGIE